MEVPAEEDRVLRSRCLAQNPQEDVEALKGLRATDPRGRPIRRPIICHSIGICGDLQEIAGKTLGEIDGLVQIARRVEATTKTQDHTTQSGEGTNRGSRLLRPRLSKEQGA